MNTFLRAFLLFSICVHIQFEHPAQAGPGPTSADWPQFRGPQASGRSPAKGIPVEWGEQKNIVWKTALPGAGASSPIVNGNRVYLTCFTGSAASSGGNQGAGALTRHLLCLDLRNGEILWNTPVPADLPEQERIREDHGYASSTPVTDGERIYAFFGKSGVFAFDLEGRQLWRAQVGTELNGWGSATSPVLYQDLLIVNASVESESLVAIDKRTGKEVWRAGGVKESWHAPVFVQSPEGNPELVVAIFRKILGFDPANGKPLWECDTGINWYMCPTPVAENGVVYSIGGRNPNGALAIKAGGRGVVTQAQLLWKANKGSNVPSPILHEGHLYFAHENLGVVYCLNAATGAVVFEERLRPSPDQIYASPVLAEDRIYFIGRGGRASVIAAKPKFAQLADNVLESNRGMFNASPAIAGSRLLLRSNRALYCVGTE